MKSQRQIVDATAGRWRGIEAQFGAISMDTFSESISPDMLRAMQLAEEGARLQSVARHAEALRCYREALPHLGEVPELHNNLGVALLWLDEHKLAREHFEQALRLKQAYPEAHANLGSVLHRLGRHTDALSACLRALALDPHHVTARFNLATIYLHLDRLQLALDSFSQTVALDPDNAEAWLNFGETHFELGTFAEARRCYRRAAQVRPGYVDAYWNEAVVTLLLGEYSEGWNLFEWRWKLAGLRDPTAHLPRWHGESLAGKTLQLEAEQGLGDTLFFARFLPMLEEAGAKVIVRCPGALCRLMEHCVGVAEVWPMEGVSPAQHADYYLPMGSLARVMGIRLDNVPAPVPWLRLPEGPMPHGKRPQWMPGHRPLRVGFACSGNPNHARDKRRSCGLAPFGRLAELPGIQWVCLQKETPSPVAAPGFSFEAWGERCRDLYDLALAVGECDLIVSVDTALVHVAGAMGVPTWILLPFAPDWRWLIERHDTPWYPTARLFRQKQPGDWAGVFDRIQSALETLTQPS
jgi:tetratricopeptide (TPR) repeat protein